MPTQIFLPVQGGGPVECQPEFFKIAEHSLYCEPDFEMLNKLYYGGKIMDVSAMWSFDLYNFVSNASPIIRRSESPLGIPIPTNLFNGDTIRITGTAYLNSLLDLNNHNYSVKFTYGIFYFDCKSQTQLIPSYSFMPLTTVDVVQEAGNFDGKVCFTNEIKLTQNFDLHSTRLLVGFNFVITCNSGPGQCPNPQSDNIGVVSYTLDVERPCKVESTNCYIIKNCCEPSITELVFKPDAQIGQFFSDNEGNCWEVISLSNDVTNFTRIQNETFTSCTECITTNPCPQNLVIQSCCVDGFELVSGSLPGLNVGDSFVDNDGLCWYVEQSGAFPITEESITVSNTYLDCEACKTANPCPVIYSIGSCCGDFSEIISSTNNMQVDDVFVDNFGTCWRVIDRDLNQLPTNYDITVVQVHASCQGCTNAHPCPLDYYLTVKLCCDPTRIEVIQIPSVFMIFTEGSVYGDEYGMCWEVISYSSTGTPTLVYDFAGKGKKFEACQDCLSATPYGQESCTNRFLVEDCNSNQYTAIITYIPAETPIVFGNYYFGGNECYKILGYSDALPDFGTAIKDLGQPTCELCILRSNSQKVVELVRCSDSSTVIVTLDGPWLALPGQAQKLFDPNITPYTFDCYTLVGLSGSPSTGMLSIDATIYTDCVECLNNLP